MASTIIERDERSARHVSWGAIFGGTTVALATWALLFSLGLALGLSSVDPNENIKGEAIFTGLWSIISPLVALFVGGFTAARLAGFVDRTAGVLHGAVLWGLTMLLGVFALTSIIGSVLGTAASAGKSALSGAASAVQSGGAGKATEALGINTDDLVGPLNQKLQQQGKPSITADQLSAAVKDAAGTSLREGKVDSAALETSLAQKTNLSRDDVRDLSANIQQRLQQATSQVSEKAADVAATAAGGVGKAMWGVFIASLLGLVSTILGAAAGVAGVRKHDRTAATVIPGPGVRSNRDAPV